MLIDALIQIWRMRNYKYKKIYRFTKKTNIIIHIIEVANKNATLVTRNTTI